jgi:hypothetical protein
MWRRKPSFRWSTGDDRQHVRDNYPADDCHPADSAAEQNARGPLAVRPSGFYATCNRPGRSGFRIRGAPATS